MRILTALIAALALATPALANSRIKDMVDVDLDSIFIVKEIRLCGEFVTVEVQEWNYGGVHLKTNIQKGQETWVQRVEHDSKPQAS